MAIKITKSGGTSRLTVPEMHKTKVTVAMHAAMKYTHTGNEYLNRRFGRPIHPTEFSAFSGIDFSFPSGLISKAIRILEPWGTEMVSPVILPPAFGDDDPDLRDYQNSAARALMSVACGHISIPTGGGKSRIIDAVVRRLHADTIVIAPSAEIMMQLYDMLVARHGKKVVSRLGGGSADILTHGRILVTTFQTACSRVDGDDTYLMRFLYNAEAIVVDECHHCPCDSIRKIISAMHNVKWQYGVSATPYRGDGQDILMEGAVGPLVYEVPPQVLVQKKVIVPGIVFMADVPKSSRSGEKSGGDFSKTYRDFVVNYIPRRDLEIAGCQQAMLLGLSTICFVKQVLHGQDIYNRLKSLGAGSVEILTGEAAKNDRADVFKRLRSGETLLVIATIGREGLDIPSVDAVVLAGGGSDPAQEVGRALRSYEGKTVSYIWDFYDLQHDALKRQSKKRLAWYEEMGIFQVSRS